MSENDSHRPEELEALELLGQIMLSISALIALLVAKGVITRAELEQKMAELAAEVGDDDAPSGIIRP